jgi:AGZA family xanthine/uracil permease-like MFS transporter
MGISAFACMAILMAKKVKGAVMVGIVLITAISWIPGHQGSYLGAGSSIPGE